MPLRSRQERVTFPLVSAISACPTSIELPHLESRLTGGRHAGDGGGGAGPGSGNPMRRESRGVGKRTFDSRRDQLLPAGHPITARKALENVLRSPGDSASTGRPVLIQPPPRGPAPVPEGELARYPDRAPGRADGNLPQPRRPGTPAAPASRQPLSDQFLSAWLISWRSVLTCVTVG